MMIKMYKVQKSEVILKTFLQDLEKDYAIIGDML